MLLMGCVSAPTVDKQGYVLPYPASKGFTASHAYLITRKFAQALLENALPIEMQVDFYLQMIAYDYNFKIRATSSYIKQASTASDVFTLCILCEPHLIYVAFLALVVFTLLIYLHLKS